MPKLSSSEAAYLLGVSTDTLRRWEKEGKITSERTEGPLLNILPTQLSEATSYTSQRRSRKRNNY